MAPQAQFDAAIRAERARLAGDNTGHAIWRTVMQKVGALQHEPERERAALAAWLYYA